MPLLFRQFFRPTAKVTICHMPNAVPNATIKPMFHRSFYRPKKTLTHQFQLIQKKQANRETEIEQKKANEELENLKNGQYNPKKSYPVGPFNPKEFFDCITETLERSRRNDMGYY